MTIKDIADLTGVNDSTVRRSIQNVFPNLLKKGIKTNLNEYQAKEIINSIYKNKNARNLQFLFSKQIIYNMFSEYKINTEYYCCGKYKVDFYIPELNLAIEFDELHHNSKNQILRDKKRQKEIEKELNCKFARYKLDYKDVLIND